MTVAERIDINSAPEFIEYVIPQLLEWLRAETPSALVTLVGVEGSSPRPVGSQMAVNINGEYVGHITPGCAEAAIVAEAVSYIVSGKNGCSRYGAGSKYIDVRLPCGSGIDVYFDTQVPIEIIERLNTHYVERQQASLVIDLAAHTHEVIDQGEERGDQHLREPRDQNLFTQHYEPRIRLVVAGKGPGVVSVARIAAELDWDVVAASPEPETLQRVQPLCREVLHLNHPDDFSSIRIDPWTASVLLFHDHEWEPPILVQVFRSAGFYIGALGSQNTHAMRTDLLRELGCDDNDINRISGPIGLDIGGRNPPEIALSIVAEILSAARHPDTSDET